jgi:hypothetical protein
MEKAMMDFTVLLRLKCVVIAPEFFDRDLLLLSNNKKEKFGTEKGGLLTHTDMCCQGPPQPETHCLTSTFPNCKQALLKDVRVPRSKGCFELTDSFQPSTM